MMPERPRRLEILDRLEVPDLWPDVTRRSGSGPPPGGPSPLRRAGIISLALLVAGSSFLLVTRLWLGRDHPATSPSPSVQVPSSNGLIYFRSQVRFGVPTAWEAIRPDGTGLRTVFAASSPFAPENIAFSPDGQRIVADLVDRPGIWVADVDGSRSVQLTQGANDAWPAWSPDGTRIAFAGSAASQPCPARRFYSCPRDLYVMNADGSELHLAAQDAIAPSWSPDTDHIAFQKEGSIAVVNADGTGEHVVTGPPTGGSDLAPTWSPDGSTIVYSSIRYEDWGIYAVPAAGGAERTLVPRGSPLGGVDGPTWSPDGKLIALVVSNGIDVMAADGSDITSLVRQHTNYGPGAIAWQPVPVKSESSSASSSVTRCVQATTAGDFDGDGTIDNAEFVEIVSGIVPCDRGRDVFKNLSSQELVIRYGSGQTLEEPFNDCQGGLCAYVFAATDLDGDGRDEFAIDVSSTAATGLVEFYRVGPDGIGPLVIAEPADPPYVDPGPAILGGSFDSALQSPITCQVKADGTRELVSVHAENVGATIAGPWKVHTTIMALKGDRLVVTSTNDSQERLSMTSEVFQNGCA